MQYGDYPAWDSVTEKYKSFRSPTTCNGNKQNVRTKGSERKEMNKSTRKLNAMHPHIQNLKLEVLVVFNFHESYI